MVEHGKRIRLDPIEEVTVDARHRRDARPRTAVQQRQQLETLAVESACAAALLAALTVSGAAQAQSMNANSASFNSGYGRYSGEENQAVNVSMADANGNTTKYGYDSSGNLLMTTYADSSQSTSTFNPLGEATSFVNANGQPINYTYNPAGQIATESFSDGTSYSYTYDDNGNMLTATDSTGTTNFTYDPTSQLLTEVAYPNGMYLKFTYNAAG